MTSTQGLSPAALLLRQLWLVPHLLLLLCLLPFLWLMMWLLLPPWR